MKTDIQEIPIAYEPIFIPMILGKEKLEVAPQILEFPAQNIQRMGSFRMEKLGTYPQSEILHNTTYHYNYGYEHCVNGVSAEGLFAAAHAGSFTIFLADSLWKKGFHTTSLFTEATVTISDSEIASIHLFITGVVKRITSDSFMALVKDAQKHCILSKLVNVAVTSEVILSLGFGFS